MRSPEMERAKVAANDPGSRDACYRNINVSPKGSQPGYFVMVQKGNVYEIRSPYGRMLLSQNALTLLHGLLGTAIPVREDAA